MSSGDHESTNESSSELEVFDDVEQALDGTAKVRHRGVYLLPNLFTTGALFCGFYAVVAGMDHHFHHAAIAIFIAMLLDGMDGRVARMTNTQSAFGEQYDSLADMVSFGVAPALVMFSWVLQDLGRWGWAAAFIYTACAALRLARFNTQIGVVDKKVFVGLASPMAAAVIAATVLTLNGEAMQREWVIGLAALTATVGLAMVSNFRYASFKGIDFRNRVPFSVMLVIVLIFAVLIIDLEKGLLAGAVIYAVSAPVMAAFRAIFKKKTNS